MRAGLEALNTCEAMAQHVACVRGCEESIGADQPAVVSDDAPPEAKPGMCLVTTGTVSCEGAHPLTSRLCACR